MNIIWKVPKIICLAWLANCHPEHRKWFISCGYNVWWLEMVQEHKSIFIMIVGNFLVLYDHNGCFFFLTSTTTFLLQFAVKFFFFLMAVKINHWVDNCWYTILYWLDHIVQNEHCVLYSWKFWNSILLSSPEYYKSISLLVKYIKFSLNLSYVSPICTKDKIWSKRNYAQLQLSILIGTFIAHSLW